MGVNEILDALNRRQCRYLLIGGMNFMLRHQPILTYDIDVWIEDTDENRRHCEEALADIGAEWGRTEQEWGPVARLSSGWLAQQGMFSLSTPFGALDIFRAVTGLPSWLECWQRSTVERTAEGISFHGLSDDDMLQCQLALPPAERKLERVRTLQDSIARRRNNP
jgi:hypothetical protein